jgi:pilus assembly protein CpaE
VTLAQPNSSENDTIVQDVSSMALLKRTSFLGFVSDPASAATLHSVFDPAFPQGGGIHVANFRTTLAVLSRMISPEVLLVDLTDQEQPLNAMMDLSEVVESGTTVLLIGNQRNLSFYRNVVNGMGVAEYVAKPLTKESVERHFVPLLRGNANNTNMGSQGRLIAVAGTRGGTGSSLVAANLAWLIGQELHCHALLLDSDMHTGTAALCLNVGRGQGLMSVLESPERLDRMLIDRIVQPVGDRLHLISGLEPVTRQVEYNSASAASLVHLLRQRYKYMIADTGSKLLPFARDLLQMAHHRITVLDPTILSIRNLERLNTLPGQSQKTLLVLNQAGRPGGLNQRYMEDTLGLRFDAVIPDLPRVIPKAEKYGEMPASIRGPFRTAMMQLANLLGIEVAAEPAAKIRVSNAA